jgi:3-phenylpropionate/cinnamic acid dioxygenase small subunit
VSEGDIVEKCKHKTIRQCHLLANLEVMERHSYIVVRVQSNYRLF